jgi:hypothetical protein
MDVKELFTMLKDQVDKKRFIDVGPGVQNILDASQTQFNAAVRNLEDAGYKVYRFETGMLTGNITKSYKILGLPNTTGFELLSEKEIEPVDPFKYQKSPCIEMLPDNPTSVDIRNKEFNETFLRIKHIIMSMDGLSPEGFNNRYMNDPHFRHSIDMLVDLMLKGGIDVKG